MSTSTSQQHEQHQQQKEQQKDNESQKVVPHPTLDELVQQLVLCEDYFCEHYDSLFTAALHLILIHRSPNVVAKFSHCIDSTSATNPNCEHIFNGGILRSGQILNGLLNHERIKSSSDPMINYNGQNFTHPFWFNGLGDIWRRVSGGSRLVSANDCQRIIRESERCFEDDKMVKSGKCFELYSQALACESGANCTYLQAPLMACMNRPSLQYSGDYEQMRACFESIEQFKPCQTHHVPLTQEISDQLGLRLDFGDV